MNLLKEPTVILLKQLQGVLAQLSDAEFIQPISVLSRATIGQHIRHIIEFYTELHKGYTTGVVDYDKRERNLAIENDKLTAVASLTEFVAKINLPDKALSLTANFAETDAPPITITTNYYRELVYNIEHTVHHMALIRIGINAVTDIEIPAGFGIAASTLKFRQACAR